MRWDDLFADLAGQLEAGLEAERSELVAELTRAERASVALVDRIRAHRGIVRFSLRDGESLTGEVADVGSDWILVAAAPHEHLVPLAAVVAAAGLTERVGMPEAGALGRLGITTALRALARDRQLVRVVAVGAEVSGMVAAVGADHLDVASMARDTMRPTGERVTVAMHALVRVSHS